MIASDTASDGKKILLIAYHFPPDSSVGALRPQKFAKYLPEFGWQPYVLTIKGKYIEKKDFERLDDVRGVPIYRTAYFRTPLQFLFDVRDRLVKKRRIILENVPAGKEKKVHQSRAGFRDAVKELLAWLNFIPDEKMYWMIPAVLSGYRIIRKEKIEYLYATSPPHTADLVGFVLAKITGARLIIDHRDPWALCRKRYAMEIAERFDKFLERQVFKAASRVISTTEEYTAALIAADPAAGNKYHTISNGYDADDFKASCRATGNNVFTLTYLGNFYLDRSPESFIKAVRLLLDENRELTDNIEVRFVGTQKIVNNISLEEIIDQSGLTDIFRFLDRVSYRESLRCMMESDVLLLFAPNQYYQIPGKTFEYMATKRPILAFTEEGATANLIRNCKAGIVVPQGDVEKIKEGLLELYHNSLNRHRFYDGVDITKFERKKQAQQLANILEAII